MLMRLHAICLGLALSALCLPAAATPSNLPVFVEFLGTPVPVKADDRFHTVYELRLTNFTRHELTLREVAIGDPPGRRILARYEGQTLLDALSRPGAPDLPDKRIIGAGLGALLFIDVVTKTRAEIPSSLSHRLVFAPLEGYSADDIVIDGVRVAVSPQPPIVLGPPLRGGGWIASHGLADASEHRRSTVFVDGRLWIAQRFAIDWIRIGANHQAFAGDPAKNENWAPYGAAVLAVANGTVLDVKDGIAENDPTADKKAVAINLDTAGGNYVTLDLGGGRFAFYAHLKPGSIAVKKGERVRLGQTIARLGNSGNADAPHLHFHVMDANAPLAADGLPYVFRKFTVQGTLPGLGVLIDGKG